jgi:hypothetical protein
MMKDVKVKNITPNKVKDNDLMAFVNYVKVKKVASNGEELIVSPLDKNSKDIRITGYDLVVNALSADQFETTEKVTKTEAAEILISSHNRPFTVSFNKADGSERVLRGRLIKPEPLLGRSMVEDLDESATAAKGRVRQVDHREINWLIVGGMKYLVK